MPPSKRVAAAEAQLALVSLLSRSERDVGELWSWYYRLQGLVESLGHAERELRDAAEGDPWAAEQVSAARIQTTEALKRTNKLLSEVKRCLV